jgi:hypothetical protein
MTSTALPATTTYQVGIVAASFHLRLAKSSRRGPFAPLSRHWKSNMRRLSIAALLLLVGCDMHSHSDGATVSDGPAPIPSSAWGLATPAKIGDYTRVDLVGADTPNTGITAGYSRIIDADTVIATVRVHPVQAKTALLSSIDLGSGGITAAGSARALDASIAQVHRFYPAAQVQTKSPSFLNQKGVLQPGQSAIVAYDELHAGQQRPMRLAIYTFCCAEGQWSYEYRFRYPATIDDALGIAEFMRATSWDQQVR